MENNEYGKLPGPRVEKLPALKAGYPPTILAFQEFTILCFVKALILMTSVPHLGDLFHPGKRSPGFVGLVGCLRRFEGSSDLG